MTRPSIYSRPGKPMTIPVRKRCKVAPITFDKSQEPVYVDKSTECHVTPPAVAARMVSYLGGPGDKLTLEPSAGTGNLANALLDSGHSQYELTMIEKHIGLCKHLYPLGPVINKCFLEYAKEAQGKVHFPRVIMNPPFKAVKAHVNAALSLMGRDGHNCPARLVALVPVTFDHPEMETIEHLDETTFSTAKVRTKIIQIEKQIH